MNLVIPCLMFIMLKLMEFGGYKYTLFDYKINISIIEELHLDQKFKRTEKFLKENLNINMLNHS